MIKTIFKNFLIIIFFLLFTNSETFACEVEEKKADFEIITNSKNNLREWACKNSKKIWLSKIWEKYQVIAEAWEYFKVSENWKEFFIFKEWVNIVTKNNEEIEDFSVNWQTEIWKYWIELYNSERKKLWLNPYKYDLKLQKTAELWSKISFQKWKIDHKRNKNDSYYNFWKIQNWFKTNWINCNIEWKTWAVENIWYGYMTCKNWDCLEETKKVVKETFNMYLKEKWKRNNSHYKSIISKELNFIWFWIYKQKIWNNRYKVYNTTHFCTNFS